MYIRLFESGPGCDYIELDIKPMQNPDIVTRNGSRPMLPNPEIGSLAKVISTLFEYTDIEEIGIGRERDKKEKEK